MKLIDKWFLSRSREKVTCVETVFSFLGILEYLLPSDIPKNIEFSSEFQKHENLISLTLHQSKKTITLQTNDTPPKRAF